MLRSLIRERKDAFDFCDGGLAKDGASFADGTRRRFEWHRRDGSGVRRVVRHQGNDHGQHHQPDTAQQGVPALRWARAVLAQRDSSGRSESAAGNQPGPGTQSAGVDVHRMRPHGAARSARATGAGDRAVARRPCSDRRHGVKKLAVHASRFLVLSSCSGSGSVPGSECRTVRVQVLVRCRVQNAEPNFEREHEPSTENKEA